MDLSSTITIPPTTLVSAKFNIIHKPYLEPVECPAPVLDLSMRKGPTSPNLPYTYSDVKHAPIYIEPPSSTVGSCSPRSRSDSSDNSMSPDYNNSFSTNMKPKVPRPFKAHPKDPLSFSMNLGSVDLFLSGKDSTDAYTEFREKMMAQVRAAHNGTNKNMRRNTSQNEKNADPTYWEKRKKNNEAAKRSRDARRAKEDEITIRCAYLEQENMQLKFRLAALEKERLQFSNFQ